MNRTQSELRPIWSDAFSLADCGQEIPEDMVSRCLTVFLFLRGSPSAETYSGKYDDTRSSSRSFPSWTAIPTNAARDFLQGRSVLQQLVQLLRLEHDLELLRPVRPGLLLPGGEALPVDARVHVVGTQLLHVHGEDAHAGELVRRERALHAPGQVLFHFAAPHHRAL